MIPRYSRPRMVKIWAPENRFKIWLEIETLAAEAMAELGTIPKGVPAALRARGGFDVAIEWQNGKLLKAVITPRETKPL